MESEIWQLVTAKIGKLVSFGSERDMQAFLMNNPSIIVCSDPESKDSLPALVKEKVETKDLKM